MRRLFVLIYFVFIGSASFSQDNSSEICQAVLRNDVFNVGQEQTSLLFARTMRLKYCNTEWESSSDVESRSTSLGINYTEILDSIGLTASDMDQEQRRKDAYKQFCLRSDDEMLFATSYSSSWRSSDTAVQAWRDCVTGFFASGTEGTKSALFPNEGLTGAIVQISRRSRADPIKFSIDSVEGAGDGINCTFNGSNAVGADFGTRTDVSLTCSKPRDIDASFALNTSWGQIGVFRIPGFNPTIAAMRTEISQLRDQIGISNSRIDTIDKRRSVEIYDCDYPATDIPAQNGYGASPGVIVQTQNAWNSFDFLLEKQCPNGQVMHGVWGAHDNHFEDRQFKFMCCSLRVSE